MTKTQQKVYDMLCRVQRFLNDHAEALGQIAQSAARKQLDALVLAMGTSAQLGVTSRTMATGEAAKTQALRRELRKGHMQPIAAIARLELRDVPEFEALHWPPAHESTPRLLRRARAMAAIAAEHAPVFTEHRLPADFAARLLAAADAVEESLAKRAGNGRDSAGAQGQLAASRSRAQYVVRVLATQIDYALAGNAELLGQWKVAKRVGLRGGRNATTAASPTVQLPAQQSAVTRAVPSTTTTVAAPLAMIGHEQQDALAA